MVGQTTRESSWKVRIRANLSLARSVGCLAACLLLGGCGETPPAGFDRHVRAFWEERDWCTPLDKPVWKLRADASFMRPDDPVVGITTGMGSYAIPWWVLKNHHVANLNLDGEEIMVTLCELCSSAAAFDPRFEGQRLHFRIVGVYNGTHIIRDEETRTIWLPFLGLGKHGPHTGQQLKRRRVDQATWADWLELHPETLVAYEGEEARKGHGSEHFPGYDFAADGMADSLLHHDDRLTPNVLVLGVVVDGEEIAYPMSTLTKIGPVLQQEVGVQSLVILHKPDSYMAAAFSRTVNNEQLDFSSNDRQEIVDRQTGSVWNFAGVAKSGPLAGTKLEPVTYIMEEWFIWAAQHPQTRIHSP